MYPSMRPPDEEAAEGKPAEQCDNPSHAFHGFAFMIGFLFDVLSPENTKSGFGGPGNDAAGRRCVLSVLCCLGAASWHQRRIQREAIVAGTPACGKRRGS